MKNWIILIALCVTSFNLMAQQQETLFNRAHVIGAFGGPIVEYNHITDEVELSVGGGGALIIDNFFIGGYGMGTADESFLNNQDRIKIDLGHGGFWLGATFQQHKLLHLYSSVKLGWGAVGITFEDDDLDYADAVFVVAPEVGIELNIFTWFKVAATGGYRWVDGIDEGLGGISKDQFDGYSLNLTFRFGGFGHWHNHHWD